MKTVRLILGDQLNSKHSWFNDVDEDVVFLMAEMRQETDYVRHHIQKICGFFAAMRAFAEALRGQGHSVDYIKLDDRDNPHDLGKIIRGKIREHRATRFEYQSPDEYRLDRQLDKIARSLDCEIGAADTEHFLTSRDEVAELFEGKKQYLMETFYRHMRRKHDVLMDGDKPTGGKWNFDELNREKYRGEPAIPSPRTFRNDVTEIFNMINEAGVDYFGKIEPDQFPWPIAREQALQLKRHFVNELLPHFGTYQDAMTTDHWALFHSRLSFALNIKLLHPKEIIDSAVGAWKENKDRIELHQVEGFVRQILGWREFMRGIYWAHMPDYETKNYFNHRRHLPGWYWDGDTKMNCLRHALGQSLEHAYAHHIQRLMVTGNFALLANCDPDQVDAWYLGVYIDAIQWVELPNTRGMSQFADGGIVGSKPYVASANYMHKMSDYCSSCHYDRKARHGDRACPFNSLYWSFYDRHRDKLANNPRVANMYRVLDNMDAAERRKTLKQAEKYKRQIDDL